MSKKKYKFQVTSFADLAKAYPFAVTEKVIPEKREQKADYAYIAKLLDCQIVVPGIQVVESEADTGAVGAPPVSSPKLDPDTDQATQADASETKHPHFLKKTQQA